MAAETSFVRYSSVMATDAGGRIPRPPPEAVLLRLARKGAGASVEAAAKAAGISKAWLSSIENGYDTRAESGIRPVRAKDEVIARLADFLEITPDRLEHEGQRPDAAQVLVEIQRRRSAGNAARGGGEPELDGDPGIQRLPGEPEFTHPDPELQALGRYLEHLYPALPREDTVALIRVAEAVTASRAREHRRGA